MVVGKINVDMLSPYGDKENFDALYVDGEKLLDSETRLATATAVDSYGRALADLSKDTYSDTTVKFDVPLDSETATIEINSDIHVIGNLNLRVGDVSGTEVVSHYWKYIGTNADVSNLFNSETQVTFMNQLQTFADSYCSLSGGKYGDGLDYEDLAKLKDYKLSMGEIVAEEGD